MNPGNRRENYKYDDVPEKKTNIKQGRHRRTEWALSKWTTHGRFVFIHSSHNTHAPHTALKSLFSPLAEALAVFYWIHARLNVPNTNVCKSKRKPMPSFSRRECVFWSLFFSSFACENLFSLVWKVKRERKKKSGTFFRVDLLIQRNDYNKTISGSGLAYSSSLSCKHSLTHAHARQNYDEAATAACDSIKLRSQLGLILWKCWIYTFCVCEVHTTDGEHASVCFCVWAHAMNKIAQTQ